MSELPKPISREVYRTAHRGQDRPFTTSVIEVEHTDFLFFTVSVDAKGYEFVAAEDMAAHVQEKITGGWGLLNLTANSACLTRAK